MIDLDAALSLVAPGAAWLRSHGTLIVADLHAGYIQTLQKRGFALPDDADTGLLARLRGLCARTQPRRIVVAGDLVHGAPAADPRRGPESPLDALLAALRGVELVVVMGNHDRALGTALTDRGVTVCEHHTEGPYTVFHGDDDPAALAPRVAAARATSGRVVLGHFHPALSLNDRRGAHARLAAFAWGPGLLCLPAFSPWARGADLRIPAYAAPIEALVDPKALQLAVCVGPEVIATGSLAAVRRVARRA